MQKKLNIAIILLLLPLMLFSQKKDNVIDEIIWVVGDEAILKSDIENIIQDAKARRIPLSKDPYCTLPEQIAVEKLFLHQAAIDSIKINEVAIRQSVNNEINGFIADVGSISKAEQIIKKPISQLREEMFERYKNQSLAGQMRSKLVENVEATPAEVRRYISKLNPDTLPTIPETVELQLLALRPPIPQTEVNRIKEELRGFAERAKKDPADFALLARLYSQDSVSAAKGGELGFAGRGVYDPDFSDVAFSLQRPNQISRVVESQFGYHLIQLIERRGDKSNFRHILLRPRATATVKKDGIYRLDSLANVIREGKMTFETAVANYSQDKETRMNAGIMMKQDKYTGEIDSRFEYQDLPSEIAMKAYAMKIGEISDAFTMIDKKTGYEMVAIVKLRAKVPTHKANVKDDYQLLKSMYEEKKRGEFLNDWIRKKQKDTYIRINPAYRKCDFQYDGWVKKI